MDNEQENKITIDIAKEPLLCYWAEKASNYGRGYLSNTVRLALEYYITHQSCMEIAKLHPPELSCEYERQPLLVFRYGMSPTICSWMDTLKSVGISRHGAIRYVLLNSMSVISEDESEFMISSCYVREADTKEIGFGQLLAKTTAQLSQNLGTKETMEFRSPSTDKKNLGSSFFLSPGTKGPKDVN